MFIKYEAEVSSRVSGGERGVVDFGKLFTETTHTQTHHRLMALCPGLCPGLSGLVTEMIQATGEIGSQSILDLCNGIVKEGSIPEDWKSSVVLPIYKGKGDPMSVAVIHLQRLLEPGN